MFIEPNDVIIFNHIPKCAGTSANLYFQSLLGRPRVGWLGMNFQPDALAAGKGLEGFRVIGGHFPRRQSGGIPRKKVFVSTIREPIDRVVSYHRFVMRQPDHPMKKQLTGDINRDVLGFFGDHVTNQQCQFLGEEATCESVLRSMKDGKTKIALSTDVKLLLHGIATDLGMDPVEVPFVNVDSERAAPEIGFRARQKLQNILAEDISLYREIAKQ